MKVQEFFLPQNTEILLTPIIIATSPPTSAVEKDFETVILEREGMLYDSQCGYCSRRPTRDLLVFISHSWSATRDNHRNSPGLAGHLYSLR